MEIGASTDEFILDIPSLFDPEVHTDFYNRVLPMEHHEPNDPDDINFTIEIGDDGVPFINDDPMWTPPEDEVPDYSLDFDYNYTMPACPEDLECVHCDDDSCVPWFWCENRKEYKVFCEKPAHWLCPDLPECIECPGEGKNCDRVFHCEEGYVEVPECEYHWEYEYCGAPECYECSHPDGCHQMYDCDGEWIEIPDCPFFDALPII